ncbi:MAG: TIGR00282 family metallophosphoesterase [Candidatus Omnitrophica bacterium]|nr:TIGR00282 family metallophosphoesterase [Candidatus Omnitrophota bacterium]
MRILFFGDIVGRPGREAVKNLLPGLREKKSVDFVIVNAENAAAGSGITPQIAEEFFEWGIDVITSGDHVWKKKEIYDHLKVSERILRPLNYPKKAIGRGCTVVTAANGKKVGVINLIGRVFMDPLDCPFTRVEEEIDKIREITKTIFVDMHAEATSEKVAMGWFLDGRVSAVVGTHTHIQTADEKILPNGTAYLTDAGMTGPYDSVIGRQKALIIEHFVTQMPFKFEMAEGDVWVSGALVEVNDATGKAVSIERIHERYV